MLEEIQKSKDIDDIVSFMESIAALNHWMKRNQETLKGLRLYWEANSLINDEKKKLIELINYIAGLALRSEKLFKSSGIRILRK